MKKIRNFIALLLIVIVGMSTAAGALSGADFKPGRIIEDTEFFDGQALTAPQVQEFLNSKVPVCDTNGEQLRGNGQTRAQYGTAAGYPPPYTCLKDYSQDVPDKAAEDGLCNGITAGSKTAAQIVAEVGTSCGISQKLLLVMLQKEQTLVTDDWPWSIQYRSAMGFGCPDTAPCDSEYYGFFNQVYHAARQFKLYAKHPTFFNYRAGQTSMVQYNPNPACGGSMVLIENQATAGLYNYTPYQPNTAALNNLYGTGDSCSAYGNRNLWRMYHEWFPAATVNPAATLTANGQTNLKAPYGDDVTVAWTSQGLTSCELKPNGATGLNGSVTLAAVKKTQQLSLECTGSSNNVTKKVTIEVQPPTFVYLIKYLESLNSTQKKQVVNTAPIVELVRQAETEYNAGALPKAEKLLQKTLGKIDDLVNKRKISADAGAQYKQAVNVLITSWRAPKYTLAISSDGCVLTATGPAGYILDYGAHDGIWQRGYGDTTLINNTGKAEVKLEAEKGMTAYGDLKDRNGNLLTSVSAEVTADSCTTPAPPANGGYPWADVPRASQIDPWGMYVRTSVSYAAYKVHASGRYMPFWGGHGNANQWDENAQAAGIPVDTTPRVGDVAIRNSGAYGHAMYVEQVNPDGTINVSQYDTDLQGNYSTATYPVTGLVFIHFP